VVVASYLNLNTIHITTADSPYQLTTNVVVVADTTGGAIIINLNVIDDYEHPTYYIKCVGAFPITVNPPAGELINGTPAVIITSTNTIQIVRDTSALIVNWVIISTVIPAPAVPPTTTKGDIRTHDTTDETRLPVGANNQMLIADSTTSTGLAWVNQPVIPTTTKGDIRTHDTADETRLPVGANNQMLIADSTTSTGLAWVNQRPIVRTHTLVSIVLNISSASWAVLARYSWLQSVNTAIVSGMLIYYINFISGRTAQVRVVNVTTNTVLGTGAIIGVDGIYTIALSPIPTANALIELQGMYAGAGTNPQLFSAHLEFSS
jgi:hypothetical protein